MKNILLGIMIGICLPFALGYLFLINGGIPMNTRAKLLPLENWIAQKALSISYKNEVQSQPPFAVDQAHLRTGAKTYLHNCAGCHGLPNHEPPRFAKGMFPRPPALFTKEGTVTDDPIGKVYWKTKNGIRLSGMPGYVDNLSDTEIWEVSALLVNADKLTDTVKKELR